MKKNYNLIVLALLILFSLKGFGLSILLVNDNNADITRTDVVKQAISDAGYDYSYYDASTEGGSPSYSLMSNFDLVIWYTANDASRLYFWNGSDSDNEEIKQYIDNGGMFWLMGLDFLYDRYKEVPYDFYEGDMMHDYFGISQYVGQSHIDDGLFSDGVPELDVVSGNGIFTLNPVLWTYDAMWYVDALDPVDGATPVYRMGPEGYDFYDYFAGLYFEKGQGKVLTFTFETARLDTPENTAELFKEGLDYFKQFGQGEIIHVTGVEVYTENGENTITENEGTLQFYANVTPDSATNKAVFWSVTPGTAYASISNDGLLTASGSNIGNGTVWVKASSADGGIADSMEVTISNQVSPEGFNILLVNDDNHSNPPRIQDIDTVMQMLDYDYTIYDIDEMGKSPDLVDLSKYELVMWYTGNDGVGLRLWDVSDTNDYKFNSDLIKYIDYGGNVWVQGLDFMYDVVGKAPDEFHAGQFIYDYMGIANYVGQSHVDDEGINLLQLDAVSGNGVCTYTPIKWVYSEGLWYADAFDITSSAHAIYEMGPNGYPFYGKACGLYNKPGKGIIMSWAFETARIDTETHTAEIFNQVLSWFKNLMDIKEVKAVNGNITALYPNPATGTATLEYNLKAGSNVTVELFNITGQKILEQNLGVQSKGQHRFRFNKSSMNINSGVYFYNLKIDGNPLSGKIVFR